MESTKKRIKNNTIVDLPSDLLLLILYRLEQDDLRPLSLVSKLFLFLISNHMVRKLTFKTLPKDRSISKIFTRFSSVNQITIQSTRVSRVLIAISNSKLNLEALKIVGRPAYPKHFSFARKLNIKSLTLDWFSKVGLDQVIEFIQLFPALEELNFGRSSSDGWDDVWVERLSLKAPNLKSLSVRVLKKLSLTDRALNALSDNCVNLEHVDFQCCYGFTPQGFCTFLHRTQNLRSVVMPFFSCKFEEELLVPLAETVSTCENLHHLTIRTSLMKDATLCIISKSRDSLKTLKMKLDGHMPRIDYTMKGLSAMLCAFQGLTRLEVCLPLPESNISMDKEMSELVKSLPCLNCVVITCYCFIHATLFSLIEYCPSIECICICVNFIFYELDRYYPLPQLIRKNYTVKHISLYPKPNSSFMMALGSYCPSLKKWDVLISPEVFTTKNPPLDWM